LTLFQSAGPLAPVGNVPPRAWVERAYRKRLIHWTEMPPGGCGTLLEHSGAAATTWTWIGCETTACVPAAV